MPVHQTGSLELVQLLVLERLAKESALVKAVGPARNGCTRSIRE